VSQCKEPSGPIWEQAKAGAGDNFGFWIFDFGLRTRIRDWPCLLLAAFCQSLAPGDTMQPPGDHLPENNFKVCEIAARTDWSVSGFNPKSKI
jgi:hypothetical protein